MSTSSLRTHYSSPLWFFMFSSMVFAYTPLWFFIFSSMVLHFDIYGFAFSPLWFFIFYFMVFHILLPNPSYSPLRFSIFSSMVYIFLSCSSLWSLFDPVNSYMALFLLYGPVSPPRSIIIYTMALYILLFGPSSPR